MSSTQPPQTLVRQGGISGESGRLVGLDGEIAAGASGAGEARGTLSTGGAIAAGHAPDALKALDALVPFVAREALRADRAGGEVKDFGTGRAGAERNHQTVRAGNPGGGRQRRGAVARGRVMHRREGPDRRAGAEQGNDQAALGFVEVEAENEKGWWP